jgi:Flp pilus assembly CpaE family ATPase
MSNSHSIYELQVNHQAESEPKGSGASVNSFSSEYFDSQYADSIGADRLSIALIGPDDGRRGAVASALAECNEGEVEEFPSYPPALDDVPRLLEQSHDVIIIDLDSNPEYALELVESICAKDSSTVMVYSEKADRDLVVRCMRAGAREFLTLPFEQDTIAEALVRVASTLHSSPRPGKKALGRIMVFLGAKGGSGVTTIACNFAVALAQESSQSTLLVDLGLPMGDAALNLGIVAEYSTDNALLDTGRLDTSFFAKLLVKHRSGLSVLAAPSKVPKVQASNEAIDKLMSIARQEFENVIVDVGSRLDLMGTALFKDASTIYLVTQAGVSELRNSNRLITQFFNDGRQKLEVVINRYEPRSLGVTEEHITKALTRSAQWKIPDDYPAARQMQNSAATSASSDSPIARQIQQMARAACGLPAAPEKKAGFSLKSLSRSIAEKVTFSEPTLAISREAPTIAWPPPAPIPCGTPLSSAQLDAEASAPGSFVYMPSAGYVLPVGTHTLWVTFTPDETAGDTPAQTAVQITVTKATPAIKWAIPRNMTSGTALSSAQLNAEASVPGTFVYSPAEGDVLAPGNHTLTVTFTPKDTAGYIPTQAEVSVAVATAKPTIAWPVPAQITCGTALSTSQLNATASVPGSFVYTPGSDEVLMAGRHTLSVTFTPTDSTGYSTAHAEVSLTVVAATPAITWSTPTPITYGTALSATQLEATASVPGTFVFTPAEGSMLTAGTHTPSVIFTPNDAANYSTAQAAVSLTVAKAKATIAWPTPASITEGTALDASQLNATASARGTLVYSPAAGEVLATGTHPLSVTFTPLDDLNYTSAQASVSLNVTKLTPTAISWQTPSAISYGTPLSAVQHNAKASVSGTLAYFPGAGDVLPPGSHTLTVSLIPTDSSRYAPSQATVELVVEELPAIDSLLAAATQEKFMTTDNADNADFTDGKWERIHSDTNSSQGTDSNQKGELETRTYKGATYEKREDGQWHLQQK